MGGQLSFFQGFYDLLEDGIFIVVEESRKSEKVLVFINSTLWDPCQKRIPFIPLMITKES